MVLNAGGIVDHWYPVVDVSPRGDPSQVTRVIWTDATEAYLDNLGYSNQRADNDRTICCPCYLFDRLASATLEENILITNVAKANGTDSADWFWGETQADAIAATTAAVNRTGGSGWYSADAFGYIGTPTVSTEDAGASYSDTTENWYYATFSIATGFASSGWFEWYGTGNTKLTSIHVNGQLVGFPLGTGPTQIVSGRSPFNAVEGTNTVTVSVRDSLGGTSESAHGFGIYMRFVSAQAGNFTTPLEDGQPWTGTSTFTPQVQEFLGVRVWPGTEITVKPTIVMAGSGDVTAGRPINGKATINMTVQVVATTQRGTELGVNFLLNTISGGCYSNSCEGVDLHLYADCDLAAELALDGINSGRRTFKRCKLTGWEEADLKPPMPSHVGRVLTLTLETDDERGWLDDIALFDAHTPTGGEITSTSALTQVRPGPRYSTDYIYNAERTGWPVEVFNDFTMCPVGNWLPREVIQSGGGSATGYIYAAKYTRRDEECGFPVRLVWDRVESTIYFETIGWTWPTGQYLPCDFGIKIIEYAQRVEDNSEFEFIANSEDGGDCCFWVVPSGPVGAVGSATAQDINRSRIPAVAAARPTNNVVPGALSWVPDPTKQLSMGCSYRYWEDEGFCLTTCATSPYPYNAGYAIDPIDEPKFTWFASPSVFEYKGGTFPPQGRNFNFDFSQVTEPVEKTITIISDVPEITGCDILPPPIRPTGDPTACPGGILAETGVTIYSLVASFDTVDEHCGTLYFEITASTDLPSLSAMVWDITDLGDDDPSLVQVWGLNPISVIETPPILADTIIRADGSEDYASMDCGAGLIPWEPYGSNGVWLPAPLSGGHRYTFALVSDDSSALSNLELTLRLQSYTLG